MTLSLPRPRSLALVMALLVLTALVARRCAPGPAPAPVYRTIVMHDTTVLRDEPKVEIRWRDRIVYRTVAPAQRAEVPEAAVPDVAAFCSAAGWTPGAPFPAPSEGHLAAGTPPPSPTPPPLIAFPRSERFDGHVLTQHLVRSDGSVLIETRRGVSIPFEWRVAGDSVVVHSSRWAGVRKWAGRAAWLGAGYAVGQIIH